MGRGPLHLLDAGARELLERFGPVSLIPIETAASFPTEIGTAFELHRALSTAVSMALSEEALPFVLSGNCNSSLGTVSGIQGSKPGLSLGAVWFDGHGDCNTPETFNGDFLDAMGLSSLTGRCWQTLAATVPGFAPLPDQRVVLVGAHGADKGARSVLSTSQIAVVPPDEVSGDKVAALDEALDRLSLQGVTHLYLHLDMDVLDASFAPANEFAPVGGLMPEQLIRCVKTVMDRFEIAGAAIASYDPTFDKQNRVLETALHIMEIIADDRRSLQGSA